MFGQLPQNKAFRLEGNDLTVFKIDKETRSIRIWFRDLQKFVAMPQHMVSGFTKRCKTRDYILVDRLPTL